MGVAAGFNACIDSKGEGSTVIGFSEGIQAQTVVFPLKSGKREALITNLEEDAFAELYYKRWPVKTKYDQLKQKLELENFSGRLVDNTSRIFTR
jgi:hypothetical protein